MATVVHSTTYNTMKELFCQAHKVPKKYRDNPAISRLVIIDSYAAKAKNNASNPIGNLGQHLFRLEAAMSELAKTPTKMAFEYSSSIAGTASGLRNQVSDRDTRLEQIKNAVMNLVKEKDFKKIVDAITSENAPQALIRGMIEGLEKKVLNIVSMVENLVKSSQKLDAELGTLAAKVSRDTANMTGQPERPSGPSTPGVGS